MSSPRRPCARVDAFLYSAFLPWCSLSLMPLLNDVHCHFFSTRFFAALGRGLKDADPHAPHETALARLGWDAPGSSEDLADRWAAELDRGGVGRAGLIASVPRAAESVAVAVRRHRRRFVGFFMVDPTQPDSAPSAVR